MPGAAEIAGAVRASLERAAARLDHEQAVHGLDALTELELHPILASGLREAGLGVQHEHHYPGNPARRPKKPERERCDLVVLPGPGLELRDPIEGARERDRWAGTLFEAQADEPPAAPGEVEPEDAFWLEVKAVGQFAYVEGIPGPNRRYAAELMACRHDLAKLAREPRIVHGGLLMVLFTADHATARHDLASFLHASLDRGVDLGSPTIEGLDITDRIGNTRATAALIPTRPSAGMTPPTPE